MTSLLQRGTAIISDCGQYRYRLERQVTASDRRAVFIMLNPSTADADQDDPTIRRCIGFSRSWGCGRLVVVNLFAFRAAKPKEMKATDDPVGPLNNEHIIAAATEAEVTGGKLICAWGAHGKYRERDRAVLKSLSSLCRIEPMSLGETNDNMPRHPLYLRNDCRPLPYAGRQP